MKLCNRFFDYKTISLMLYVLPFSMSLTFRLVIFSTLVTWISHLFYGYWYGYIYTKGLLGVIIPPLVLARHLGR